MTEGDVAVFIDEISGRLEQIAVVCVFDDGVFFRTVVAVSVLDILAELDAVMVCQIRCGDVTELDGTVFVGLVGILVDILT